ncbi:hypothetical protein K431DRAFT_14839 [Polychaeton citri CBS 116435]|uniref:Uncharacterized protein n=1 Tax=Polychaeton citri CBS 116435 TaxID=1314669 RepID=A0A9P4USB0_9PEZI|nr:hypothetical protein K431DRAFT_14839 [Polychaeton citri CBS 116435]
MRTDAARRPDIPAPITTTFFLSSGPGSLATDADSSSTKAVDALAELARICFPRPEQRLDGFSELAHMREVR